MPISGSLAYDLAAELITIPECPRTEITIKAIAKHLVSICHDEREARWVVNEAQIKWESWQGPKALSEMLFNHLNPEIPPPNQYRPMPPPEAPTCKFCGDWGHLDDAVTKIRIWCQCEMGKWQETRHPGLMEALNRNKSRQRAFSAPVTRTERKASPEWLKQLEGSEK